MSETSVYRNEDKYLIPVSSICDLRYKLDKILHKDKNANSDKYMVRSLYFDSINNIDFQTKLAGTNIRKKIRIRVYDLNSNKCKIEMKQKSIDLQHKISLWITKSDAKNLINGKYDVLKKYFKDSESALKIYTTMQLGCYRPVVMIEYDRIAYTYPMYNTRITFDLNLRASESNFDLFDEKPAYNYFVDYKNIMEVKYNKILLGFISQVLKPYKLSKTAISKYCIGRKVFYDFNF